MAGKSSQKNSMTWIMVAIVVVVLALGVIAVKEPIGEIINNRETTKIQNKIASGEGTINDMADLAGMTADEFLASYDVEGITGDSKVSDFEAALTLEQFCTYAGISYDEESFKEYKAQQELGDDVTSETKDTEVKYGYANYMYQAMQAAEEMINGDGEAAEAGVVEEAVAE